MTTLEAVQQVRALLKPRKNWTKGAAARTQRDYWFLNRGVITRARSDKAVCWCLTGAIERVRVDSGGAFNKRDVDSAICAQLSFPVLAFNSLQEFNDHRKTKHRHVLALLDRTIKALS